jgi:hypothetical protein
VELLRGASMADDGASRGATRFGFCSGRRLRKGKGDVAGLVDVHRALGAAGRTAASRGSPSARAHSEWPADSGQTTRRGARVHLDGMWVTMADAWPML